ncbi:hypothetical protein ASG43_09410 [Aureimonas sp. Leaf454]|uniref:hypothetical protein n=1 Tax=Aureimonas sp. Leaf454 TaxID=1736381 RepID=UPI000701B431|nr:hypothetical protein [Aureimonas sp. Leaf454]KQT47339.1 hypothetical protein ASG43_09410 [Aureimonas sp. Leaf454]
MKKNQTARVTIGTLHRVSDTKPVLVSPADMAPRDAEVVRSINRIMRNLEGDGTRSDATEATPLDVGPRR